MPPASVPLTRRQVAALLLAGAALLALRLWRLPATGLPDYDSVRNWQLVQELAAGDWQHLFHSASPGARLVFVPLAWLGAGPAWYLGLNAAISVGAVVWFAGWVVAVSQREAGQGPAGAAPGWAPWEAAALALLGGTGLLLSLAGRDFTGTSLSLLVSTGLLRAYARRLDGGSGDGPARARALVAAAVWLALGLSLTYKFLLLLPVLAVLEALRADPAAWRGGTGRRVAAVLALPYVVLGAVGTLAAGLPWYRWPAAYYRLLVPAAANLAGRQATLRPDLSYYPRYLLAFESPLLLLGLGLSLGLALRLWRRAGGGWRWGQPAPLLLLLLVWSGCLLAGLSLLVKAPRALLFVYLPLAALAALSLRQLLPRAGLGRAVVLALALALNLSRLWQQMYRYPPPPYAAVAAWLRAHGATRVASTVGLGLAPHLGPGQTLRVITDERELGAVRRAGYQYVLLDGYWRPAGVARFDSLRRQLPVAAWPAPALSAPLLFLEHSEYTGLGYEATLAAQRAAAADSLPLRLYRLGEINEP